LARGKEIRQFGKHAHWVWGVAYAPTLRAVVSSGKDGLVVLWDVGPAPAPPRQPPAELSAAALEAAWADLADADAGKAFDAALALAAASPQQVIALLRKGLKPAVRPTVDHARIARLIRDLDDDTYTVRDAAMRELERLGDIAGPDLRKAQASPTSIEVRERIRALVGRLERAGLSAEDLRATRALRVLEALNELGSRAILALLADGDPDHPLTREAATVLRRVSKRPAR
jgi:hypothetical protein